jgi:fatty acid-binding protein DegV
MFELMHAGAGPGPLHAAVMHADVPEEAERLRRRVESEFACAELFVSEFSPVMGAHTGPGLLGVAFWTEDDRPKR